MDEVESRWVVETERWAQRPNGWPPEGLTVYRFGEPGGEADARELYASQVDMMSLTAMLGENVDGDSVILWCAGEPVVGVVVAEGSLVAIDIQGPVESDMKESS